MRKLNKDDTEVWLNQLTAEEYYPITKFKRLNDKQQQFIIDRSKEEIDREPYKT